MRCIVTALCMITLAVGACGSGESSTADTTMQTTTSAVDETVKTLTAPELIRAEPFDVAAFAAAWGSGDADQIRTFYTDDAVMMPFGHILSTLSGHPMPEYWDIAGPDMDREAAEHDGATFEILSLTQNGNMVVTTGQWTFPEDRYPNLADTVIQTASIMHLSGDKIWRVFGDFEVYVDGKLIEM